MVEMYTDEVNAKDDSKEHFVAATNRLLADDFKF